MTSHHLENPRDRTALHRDDMEEVKRVAHDPLTWREVVKALCQAMGEENSVTFLIMHNFPKLMFQGMTFK